MASPPRKDVERFFHINVNCTNFAESLSFYQLVGFEKILDFDETSGPVRSSSISWPAWAAESS